MNIVSDISPGWQIMGQTRFVAARQSIRGQLALGQPVSLVLTWRFIMSNNSKRSVDMSTCAKGFEFLCVDPNLFVDPRGVTAMELIAGESVDWMKHTNGLMYLTRDKIRSYIGPGEKLMSVDISEAAIECGTRVLLPYVLANFL